MVMCALSPELTQRQNERSLSRRSCVRPVKSKTDFYSSDDRFLKIFYFTISQNVGEASAGDGVPLDILKELLFCFVHIVAIMTLLPLVVPERAGGY